MFQTIITDRGYGGGAAAPHYGGPCQWRTGTGSGWGFRYWQIMWAEYTLDWLQSKIFLVFDILCIKICLLFCN